MCVCVSLCRGKRHPDAPWSTRTALYLHLPNCIGGSSRVPQLVRLERNSSTTLSDALGEPALLTSAHRKRHSKHLPKKKGRQRKLTEFPRAKLCRLGGKLTRCRLCLKRRPKAQFRIDSGHIVSSNLSSYLHWFI